MSDQPESGQVIMSHASDPARLPEILLESVMALKEAGEIETACRLAGRACVALRHSDPRASHRFDVLLHRWTSRPGR